MPSEQTRGSLIGRLVSHSLVVAAVCLPALPRLAAQSADPDLYSGMRWRLAGPYRSGNVYAVSGVPGDPTTFYLGLPEGGVWKTTDGGTVWKPISDEEHVPSIGSVAVAPSDPQIVYAGTGDPTGWSFTPGDGMYKSTDAGNTWQKVGLDDTPYLSSLLVDPQNAGIVLAGAATRFGPDAAKAACGVYRTTDGGRTWHRVLFIDDRTGVADLAFDYADPGIVYATVTRPGGGFGPPGATQNAPPAAPASVGPVVYKSIDEGATWTALSQQGLPAGLRSATIAVAAGTHGQRVYVLVGGRDRGVYRSDDGGANWQLGTTHIASAGGRIYVDPKNPDVVYLMGTAMYRSLDGAHTFVAYKGAPGGDDDRALWIDPTHPEWMVMGSDQGPTISLDGGRTWTPWFNLPNGQFYHISTDNQFPYWIYGAQQDSGTAGVQSRSDFGGIRDRDWYPVGGFEAGYIAVDPLNPRWIFTQGWYHVLRRFDRETGQVVVVYTPSEADRFSSMPPLAYSPQNLHLLYMGAQYVLTTEDGGVTWKHISPDLTVRTPSGQAAPGEGTPSGRPRPVAIESLAPSPVQEGVIWAGTGNGVIEVTRDGGQTWSNVSPPALEARSGVIIIDASHHNAGTAYAAVEDTANTHPYIYRTTDFGQTWQAIIDGLPDDVRVRSVREDPVSPGLLFAATEMGAWVSFDRGGHWQSLQLNLPNTVVSDLTIHDEDLVASTYGRSLWILDDLEPLRQISEATGAGASGVYLYKPEPALRVRWSNDQDTPLPPEVPRGENPPEGAIIDYYLKEPARGPVTLGIYDAAGHLVREYSSTPPPPDSTAMANVPDYWFAPPTVLSTSAGMHRMAWDLRYPFPKSINYGYFGGVLDYTEYTLTWHAIVGATPRVQPVGPIAIPGTYEVRLSVNGHDYTRALTLKNDPRSPVTQSDLDAQFATEQQVVNGLSASFGAYSALQKMRDAVTGEEVKAAQDSSLEAAAKAFDKKAAGLMNAGFGIANRDLARRLQDLDFGDMRPTASDLAAIDQSCHEIETSTTKFDQLRQQDLPALNQLLAAAHLPELTAPADPPAGGCGLH
jgi:photosystem II stability/assembly factor-like uncharacterized protein